jgi:multidrug efflux pump subunit AcrA (membrane-fusion protein)
LKFFPYYEAKMNIFKKLFDFFKKRKKTTLFLAVFLIIVGFFVRRTLANSSRKPSYQTTTVQKGTLVSSISASGVISLGGTTDIMTSASGVVKKVYVKNGETVAKGQKLAELALDDDAESRQTIAYAAYIDAVNAEKTSETNKVTADIQMWKDRQAIFDALDDQDYKNNNAINPETKEEYTDSEKAIIDKTVDQSRKAFDASETAYKNADAQINKAKAQISSAWRNYQKASATITAPSSGVVSNFALSPGLMIISSLASASSSSEGNGGSSVSSQKIGSISYTKAQYQALVNLSEIDVIKVNPDQKVSLTLDAFPEKTFTGKVLSIDTAGKVSSGVTTYPTTILLDSTEVKVYPNMSVTANIIIDAKTDVLLVPNSAIQSQDGQSVVRVLNEDELEFIPVEIGLTSETQTEIVSGISEGTEVVTAVVNAKTSSTTTSPFGTMRMGGMGGGTSRQQIRIEK